MKRCNRCHRTQPLADFYIAVKMADGHQSTCKECQLRWQRDRRQRIKSGEHIPQKKMVHPQGMKVCTQCHRTQPATATHYSRLPTGYLGLQPTCKKCDNIKKRNRRHALSWSARLVEYVRGPRHDTRTVETFDLTPLFLEELLRKQQGRCAWTGVPMSTDIGSDRLRLITLDRLDNTRGYTRDNIALVCKAANQARGNVSLEEFVRFLDDVRG